MLNWDIWEQHLTENRVTLSDGVDMIGGYTYLINSDISINGQWQNFVMANTDFPTARNFKIRAYIRKNTNLGSFYLFGRASSLTKQAYILELKDNLSIYKGVIGQPFSGPYLDSTGEYVFPKNVTHHLEIAFHTEPNNQTFIQVKYGDKAANETWKTVFSIVVQNETRLEGYWGFGVGTYTRRENYYVDNIQYFLEH